MAYSFIMQPAQPGGDAILLEYPCTIDNTYGYIAGGGGGGGGSCEIGGSNSNNCPGGGGAGIPAGAPGDVTWSANYSYGGQPGTELSGGPTNFDNPGVGKGGDRGTAGNNGGIIGQGDHQGGGTAWNVGGVSGRSIVNVGFLAGSAGLIAGKLFGPTA